MVVGFLIDFRFSSLLLLHHRPFIQQSAKRKAQEQQERNCLADAARQVATAALSLCFKKDDSLELLQVGASFFLRGDASGSSLIRPVSHKEEEEVEAATAQTAALKAQVFMRLDAHQARGTEGGFA